MNRPPPHLDLPGKDEAHVWTASVAEALTQNPWLENLLSAEEKNRAARFHHPADRSRYLAAHGILRQLLGQYLSVVPAEVTFSHSVQGKPSIARHSGQPPLSFNLSHSGDALLFALSVDRAIGVDVEAMRENFDVLALAQSHFSAREIRELGAVSGLDSQREAFFRCWTRKEAYLKARGEGLGFSLKDFSVAFADATPPAVVWVDDDPGAAERWSMWNLSGLSGYAGAVVCAGRPLNFILHHWTGLESEGVG